MGPMETNLTTSRGVEVRGEGRHIDTGDARVEGQGTLIVHSRPNRGIPSYLPLASASVGATTVAISVKTFTVRGSRPFSEATARMSSTCRRKTSSVGATVKTASACRAAEARRMVEVPACQITDVRCGDGSQRWMPGTEKYFPGVR